MAYKLLSCPNCKSTFRLPEEAIGEAGKQVRCSKCAHEWLALREELRPDPEEILKKKEIEEQHTDSVEEDPLIGEFMKASEHTEEDISDEISESDADETNEQSENNEDEEDSFTLEENYGGHLFDPDLDLEKFEKLEAVDTKAAAEADLALQLAMRHRMRKRMLLTANMLVLLLVLFTALLAFRNEILPAAPFLKPFYTAIGYESTDNLTLAELNYTRNPSGKNRWRYVVRGSIVNQGAEDVNVPSIRARLFSKEGELLNEWKLTDGEGVIKSGESTMFTTKNLYSTAPDANVLSLDIGSPLELMLRK